MADKEILSIHSLIVALDLILSHPRVVNEGLVMGVGEIPCLLADAKGMIWKYHGQAEEGRVGVR